MFCTKCGTDLPDDSRFCRSCGQTLGVFSTGGGAAAAVAPARIPAPVPPSTTYRLGRFIGVRLPFLLLLLVLAWYFMRINYGSKGTSQAIASVVHTPITLKDEVQNLPAASWKAVALNLPYSGTINVSLQVVRGNPIDVFLTSADQLETMKKEQWNNVQVYSDFNGSETKTYRRDGQLGQGSYYLVMRDTSLGILSSSASDVSVRVQLNP
jgi:zinc-ribbon domain